MTKQTDKWAEKFDKKFTRFDVSGEFQSFNGCSCECETEVELIKQFIKQTLEAQEEDFKKVLRDELKRWNGDGEYYANVSEAISNIISIIKKNKYKL